MNSKLSRRHWLRSGIGGRALEAPRWNRPPPQRTQTRAAPRIRVLILTGASDLPGITGANPRSFLRVVLERTDGSTSRSRKRLAASARRRCGRSTYSC